MYTSQLPLWNIADKRVLLRTDYNVPLQEGNVISDIRLQRTQKTVDFMLQQKGLVTIITHVGRPKGVDPALSTELLLPWFQQQGYKMRFASSIESALALQQTNSDIILLENVRFFPGEKAGDTLFAQQLSTLGTYFVNDAFGALHNKDASIAQLPRCFDPEKRTVGFLVADELNFLTHFRHHLPHPFAIILGGAKLKEKIPYLWHLLDIADIIFLLPPLVFTFLSALGKPVGLSYIDVNLQEDCKKILKKAEQLGKKIIFPSDYQIADPHNISTLYTTPSTLIPSDKMGIAGGPQTIDYFMKELSHVQSVLYNGAVGFAQYPATQSFMIRLLQKIAAKRIYSVITGGDTIAALEGHNMLTAFSYISTGGGVTLQYLAGLPLPGLETLIKK